MLFDGAIGATADAIVPEYDLSAQASAAAAAHQQDRSNQPTTPDQGGEPVADGSSQQADDTDPVEVVVLRDSDEDPSAPATLVFIDSRVPDHETLVAAAPTDARVVLVDQNQGGVLQMAAALDGLHNVESVHIVSYGETGRLYLGSSVLTAETIAQPYAELFVQIGDSLAAGADLLVYGCYFGVDTEAGSAAQALATATGADVASSVDLTGSSVLGGDWDLERQTGVIETLAINPTNWTGILDPITISVSGPPTVTPSPGTTTAGIFGNIYGNAQSGVRLVPTTGTIVGSTALWTNAGMLGSQPIDLLATVIDADADDYIQFSSPTNPSATADDPTVIVGDSSPVGSNPDTDSRVQIRWQIFEAGTNTPASGEFAFLITDIDGVNAPGTREAIAASINDPVSYTLANPTDLVGSVQGELLQADGTVPNTGGNESLNERVWVRFNWVASSEFTLTYILYANNGVTPNAGFTHDGDGDLQFSNGGTTASIPKIDLDDSGAGNDFATTFTEAGGGVSIADIDINISNTGGTVTGATIVLTNRQAGDTLNVGALPGGIAATTDLSDPNQITITLSGATTDANYETAIGNIQFSNSSDAPDTTPRTITAQVSNSLTAGNTAEATINVVPVNDAPVNSVPGAQSATEDSPYAFAPNAITVSDVDAGGANLTTTLSVPSGSLTLGSTAGVTVSGNNTGNVVVTGSAAAINSAINGLTYNPATDVTGPVVLQVSTSDNGNTGSGGTLTDTDTITINLAGVNDAPVAADDNQTTAEDTPLTFDVRGNDTDVDGDPLAVTQVNGTAISVGSPVTVSNGVVSIGSGGQLTFTPNGNYNGTTSFTYTVSDGNGGTSSATATVTVSPVNDAPVAGDDSVLTNEDTPVNIGVLGNDGDVEGPVTVVEIDGTPATPGVPVIVSDGSVTLLADGTLDFDPTPNYNGTTSFQYTIEDAGGATDTATVTVAVVGVNDDPVAQGDTYSTPEDTPLTVDVRSNDGDVDGHPLTVSQINGTPVSPGNPVSIPGGSVSIDGSGLLTFTPAPDFNGLVTFDYTVDDANGGTDVATVNLTVGAVNDAPVTSDDSVTTSEESAVVVDAVANDSDAEGDALAITAINGSPISVGNPVTVADGTVSLLPDGTLQFDPTPDYNGTTTFTYTVSDGNGGTDTAQVSVTVNNVNDAPVASDDSASAAEDTTINLDVLANDGDIDGDAISVFTIDGVNATVGIPVIVTDGSVTLLADGTLDFVPVPNFNGNTSFTYEVSDTSGATASAQVNLTFTPVNDAPVASDDTISAVEDTPVTIEARSNDGDVDGHPLTITEINGTPISVGSPVAVPNGTVSINASGILTFSPAPDYFGPASFDYTVDDGNGLTDTATVNMTISAQNDAPVASDDNASTAEETTVNLAVLGNDSDVDGDALSVVQIDGAAVSVGVPVAVANGSAVLQADGSIDFTPNTNYNGTTGFDYTVSDGNGGSDTATATVTVTPANDAPVASDDTASGTEDTPVNLDVIANDNDIDGDTLAVSAINGTPISVGSPVVVTNGTVTLQPDGSLTFTPAGDYNGPASFDYTVSDGNGGTDTATVTLTLNPANDAPVAADDIITTGEDTPVNFDVRGNDTDVDGDSLSVTAINGTVITVGSPVDLPEGRVILLANGTLTFAPAPDYNGPLSFNYTVSDGNSGTDTATVSLTVTPANDAPQAVDDTATVAEDNPVTIDLVGNDTDIDGDGLQVTAVNGSPISVGSPVAVVNGTVALQPDGTVVFTPAADYNGPASFDYTVNDGNGGTDTGNVNVTVTPENDAPVAADDTIVTDEDTPVIVDPRVNDVDIDGDGLVTVSIDGSPVSVGTPQAVANGTVTLLPDGTLQFSPAANFNGNTSFGYTVSDTNGGSDSATVNLAVNPVNDAPVATDDAVTGTEDAPVSIDAVANDTDVDGDTLVVSAINGTPISVGSPVSVTNGTVALQPDGSLTFTPAGDYNGPASFDYTVSDGAGGLDTATVNITVNPANDAPVASDDTGAVDEDSSVTLDLVANDTDLDGDTLGVSAINGSPVSVGVPVAVTNGSVTLQPDGTVVFTPATDYNGPAAFDYTVSDGNGGTDTATASITVNPVNDVPVASDDSVSTAEDTPVAIAVVANDTDIDGDTLFVTDVNGSAVVTGVPQAVANGTVTLQVDGSLLFSPAADFNGSTSFTYVMSDGNGGTDTATVTVNVTPVNDAPVATDDTISTAEDTPVNLDVLSNDTDIDGDTLGVSAVNGTAISVGSPVAVSNGTVALQPDGTLTFSPAPDYNGPVSFDYTVSDGNGGTDTATVNINVTPANDAPVASDDTGTVDEDSTVALNLVANDTDIDGDPLAVTAIDGTPVSVGAPVSVANGTATLRADGSVSFAPDANYNGPASFDYTVSDGNGGTDTATVSITVNPVNDAPAAIDDSGVVDEDNTLILDLVANDTDIDGDALSVSAINGTAISVGSPVAVTNGTVSLQPDGTVAFLPAADYNGPVSFDYTVSDGNGGSDTATVNITVNPVNDAPLASDDTASTAEEAVVNIDVLGNDSDIDGDTLGVSAVNGSAISVGTPVAVANGSVALQPDGSLTFTPDTNYNGTTSFDYTAADGNGGSANATVTVTVSPVNDAPVASDDTSVTAEDTPVNLNVLVNDSDVDGDALSITRVNGTAVFVGSPLAVSNGSVTLQGDGTLTYTPDTNYTGPASFTYTVSDGNGGQDTATVNLTITPTNDAPVAADDAISTAEDTPVNVDVRVNDTDADGDALSVTAINGSPISVGSPVAVTNGSVSLQPDGTLTFSPAADYNGPASFDYTVSDGVGGLDTATVNITVNPANDAPVAADDSATVDEDASVALDLVANDTDIDGDTLTVSAVNGTPISVGSPVAVTNGTVALQPDGTVVFAPAANYNGPVSFDYSVSDGNGATDTATANITVNPINDAPVAVDDTVTTSEDTPVAINVVANDTDIDGDTLFVTDVNGSAIITDVPQAVANGTVTLQADGSLLFSPAADFNGSTSFTYAMSDGNGGADTATVTVNVTPVNDAPLATDDTVTTAEDTPVNLNVLANDTDIDGDTLAVSAVNGTPISVGSPVAVTNGSVALQPDGTLTFTPSADYNGPVSFEYTASDGNGGTDTATVNITVTPVNDAPLAIDDSTTTAEDTPVNLDVRGNDSDIDGDALNVTAINGSAIAVGSPVAVTNGSVSLQADDTLTFTPATNYNGPASFAYTVSDGNGGSDTATVSINVTPVNDAPNAVNDNVTTNEDTPVVVDPRLNDSDIDGDSLVTVAVDGSALSVGTPLAVSNGTVTLLPDGTLQFSPAADFNGTTSFAYTVSDSNGGSAGATVNVTVNPANDNPVAVDDTTGTTEDTPVNLDVVANDNDVDGDSLSIIRINGSAVFVGSPLSVSNGTVTLQGDGTLTFTPDTNYTGPASFTYTVSDGNGGQDTATVNLTITPTNDAPVASDDAISTAEDVPVNLDVRVNDTDADGNALSVTAINGTPISTGFPVAVTNGTVALQPDGSLTFTPASDYNGPASFDYTVSDGVGGLDTATVNITVNPANDAPVATDDTATVDEDASVTLDLVANDTDIDGDTLTVSAVNGTPISVGSPVAVTNGTVALQPDGTVIFTPATDYNGPASFDYTISDGNGSTDTATANISVNPTNDAPVASDDTVTTAEDTPVNLDVRPNDTDIDGDTLAVSAVNGSAIAAGTPVSVSNGSVSLEADGTLTFTPDANYVGPASFDYTVTDGNGGTASATVSVTVTPANDAPAAADDSAATTEDTPVNLDVLVNDSDIDGDTLGVSAVNGTLISVGSPVTVTNGTVAAQPDGTLTFTPDTNFNGSASFDYTASDGNGGSDTATVIITVTPANDAPSAADDSGVTDEDTALTLDLVANDSDVDGDALVVSAIDGTPVTVGAPVGVANGTVTLQADGTVVFNPAANYFGPVSFDYTVSDGNGATDTATVSITVNPVNDAPDAVNDNVTTDEDTPITVDPRINDVDIDGDGLVTVMVDGNPMSVGTPQAVSNGTVTLLPGGMLDFTPAADFNGNTSFSYTVSDSNGGSASATVNVTVNPVNDAPAAADDSGSTAEDTPVNLDVLANDSDVDGDALSITRVNGTAVFVGTPVPVLNGSVTLQPDGTLTFAPSANYNGPASFTYTVSDGNGGQDTATVNLTITPANDAPVAADDSIATTEDTPVNVEVRANDNDPDGNPLTVIEINGSLVSVGSPVAVSNGTVELQADGSLTFSPTANYNGPAAFNYTVSDGNGGLDTASVNITVNPANDAPVALDDTTTVDEDASFNLDLVANDTDIDGDSLFVSAINGTPVTVGSPVAVVNGTATLQADGTVVFAPAANYNGPASFDYTISDGNGGTDTATANITINPVNDAPVAADDSGVTTEDTALTLNLVGNDIDPDGDALTISSIDGTPATVGNPVTVANGTVTLQADGSVVFMPAPNYNGPATFAYTVSDGNGGTASATVNIAVNPANDAPAALEDTASTAEDTPLSLEVRTNDTDIDGDSLTVSAIDGTPISVGSPVAVSNGMVALQADGSLVFTPAANYAGPASFNYTVDDGNGGSDTATVNITVVPVNDAPLASDDSTTTAEDTTVNVDVLSNDSDVDGDALVVIEADGTALSVGVPVPVANGSVTLQADGTLDFAPVANFNGSTSFSYTISDPSGVTDTATVTIGVNPQNDAPIAVNDGVVTDEDTALAIEVRGNDTDPDGDSLTVTSVDGTPLVTGTPVAVSNGTVTRQADGQLLFAPAANFAGATSFDYVITDPSGATDTATVTVTVNPFNDAPLAVDDTVSTNEDTPVNLEVRTNDIDPDGDPLNTIRVDGTLLFTGTPVAVSNGTVTLQADGSLTFSPATNFSGSTGFAYTVSDGSGGQASANVTVLVGVANDAPVANDDSASTAEDAAVTIDVVSNDTDVDGDTLSAVTIDGQPAIVGNPVAVANGTATLQADGRITFAPSTNYNGITSFDYGVSDGNGGSDTATVTVTVTPANDAPVAVDDSRSTSEDIPVLVDVIANDIDIDGDSLAVTDVNGSGLVAGVPVAVANGSVTLQADGTLSFAPASDFNGTSTFTYTVDDSNGGSDTATVTIDVLPVNDAPIATDDAFTTAEDTTVTIDPRGNDSDPDGDALTVTSVNGSALVTGTPVAVSNGTVTLRADGALDFSPAANFNGTSSFSYGISDGNGGTDTANITVTVSPANDGPVAVDDATSTSEETPVNINVLGNDSDIDGDILDVTEVDGITLTTGIPVAVSNGSVVREIDGSLTFQPATDFNGATSFAYTTSDSSGLTASATVTVNVTAVNDAPQATDDTAVTPEETAVTLELRANDTDPDGDALTVTRVNGTNLVTGVPQPVSNGSVTLQPDGTVIFTPATNFTGNTSFGYEVSDGNGATANATATVSVTPVNDSPVAVDDNLVTAEDTAATIDVRLNDSDPEGDTLQVMQAAGQALTVGNPVSVSNGTVTLQADGQLVFDPAANFTGATSFTYTVGDGNGGQDSAVVSITINPVNDAPAAIDDNISTPEDTPVNFDPRGNDSDPEGDPLAITRINGAAVFVGAPVNVADGTITLQADGTLTFAPDSNFTGATSVTYSVSDGAGGNATATVNLLVTPVNDTPVAVDDTGSTAEDTPLTLELRANDTDPDGDTLRVSEVNGSPLTTGVPVAVANGSVTLQADGRVVFAPAADFNGNTVFTYTVTDDNGGSASALASVDVSPVNDAPVANDDTASGAEDSTITLDARVNDSDPEGDSLAVSHINGFAVTPGVPVVVANGSVTLQADGRLAFTPDANFNGSTSFDYSVSDGNGGQASATVTLNITPANDAPFANNDSTTTAEDTPVTVNVIANDGDLDGDSLSVATVNGFPIGVGGSVTVANGTVTREADDRLTFAPDTNFNGTTSFAYTVQDPSGSTASASVTIDVSAVNDAPLAVPDTAITGEGDAVSITVRSNDIDTDGDPLVVSAIDGQAVITGIPVAVVNGTVTRATDGSLVFQPVPGFQGVTSFSYQVTDPGGATASSTVTVTVTPPNPAPVAVNDLVSGTEDSALVFDALLNDSDPDAEPINVTRVNGVPLVVGLPVPVADGSVTLLADGRLSFQPLVNFNGSTTFDYTIADPLGATDTATVQINLAPVDDPIVAVDDNRSTTEDTPVTVDVRSNDLDPDNDPLVVTDINGAAIGTGTPMAVANGSVLRQPDGTLVFTPAADFNGSSSFTYSVADGNGSVSTATVTVNVSAVNDAPQASDDTVSTAEDTPVLIDVTTNDSDPDGDALAVAQINGNPVGVGIPVPVSSGIVVLQADGRLNFAPVVDFNGIATFDYTITDGNGGTSTATVAVNVNAVNDTPTALNDTATTAEDTPVNLALLANDTDPDGDSLVVVSIDGVPTVIGTPVIVTGGSVTLQADGSVTFAPAPDFSGLASFGYIMSDGNGGTDSATANIVVTPVNDLPLAADDVVNTSEDTPVTFDARVNDGDVDGHPLVVSHINGLPIANATPVAVANGEVSANASGQLTFAPAANFSGTTSFVYTVNDNNGGTALATVTVNVASEPDAPAALGDAATTPADTPVTLDVLVNDTDSDGDPLGVTLVNGQPALVGIPVPVANGTVTRQADNQLSFAPNSGFQGIASFTYTVSDPGGLLDTASVDITVLPPNAPPIALDDSYTVVEDGTVPLAPLGNDSDPEGGTLTVNSINGVPVSSNSTIAVPNGNVRVGADGSLVFEPLPDYNGTSSFAYTVRDNLGATSSATMTVTVIPVADSPVAIDDSVITNEDTPINIAVLGNDGDPDGDALTVTAVNGQPVSGGDTINTPNGRVIVLADGSLTFAPAPDFNGLAQFSYTAADPSGQAAQAQVRVTVLPVNDAPDAVDDNLIGVIGQPLQINPVGNDTDPESDGLMVRRVAGQPILPGQPVTLPEGTVSLLPDGRLEFVPIDDSIESVSFSYEVGDASGETATATITVRLQAVSYIELPDGYLADGRISDLPPIERNGEYDPLFISPAVRLSQRDTGYADTRSLADIESTTSDRFAWNHSQNAVAVPSLLALADQASGDGSPFGWVRSDNPLMLSESTVICESVDHNDNLQCWDDELPDSVRKLQYVLIDDPVPAVADPGEQAPARKQPGLVKRSDVLPLPSAPGGKERFAPFSNQLDREASLVGNERVAHTEPEPLI